MTTTIIVKWTEFKPDPRQYRQNSVTFEPVNTFVEIEVPENYVVSEIGADITTLNLDGLKYIQQLLDNTLEETNDKTEIDVDWKDFE